MGSFLTISQVKSLDLVWVDEKRVAEIIGLAVQTLRNWRFTGAPLPYYKIGRSVRYPLSDVRIFMEQRRIDPK